MSSDKLDAMWEEIAASVDHRHYEIVGDGHLIDSNGRHIITRTLSLRGAWPDYQLALPSEGMISIEYTPPKWDQNPGNTGLEKHRH
jgi:hypothetical protein